MKRAMHVAAVLAMLLLMGGCQRAEKAPSHKKVKITVSGSTCSSDMDPVHVSHGDDVQWTGGQFEVTFDKGDGSPCNEKPPWAADSGKVCTIGSGAGHKTKYRYKITDKQANAVCADPSVQVDD